MSKYDGYLRKISKMDSKDEGNGKKDNLAVEVRHLRGLLEITEKIVGDLKLDEVLGTILENAVALTNADRGFIMLNNDKGAWDYQRGIDSDLSSLSPESFSLSMSIINLVVEKGETVLVRNVIDEEEFMEKRSIMELGLRMILASPLQVHGEVIGVIYVDSITPAKIFAEREKQLFELYSRFASVAIWNARLYESGLLDALTGLPNSHSFYLRFDDEISQIQRSGMPFSVIMVDIDDFKAINYTYGYLFGNRLLEAVGRLIGNSVKKPGFAARFGGDEFIILLPQADAVQSKVLAEKLLAEMKCLPARIEEEEIDLCASVGIVSYSGEQLPNREQLIVEVENAINLSKSQGGGKCTVMDYHESQPLPEEIVGVSDFHVELPKQVEVLSTSTTPCLILGETGVGKELVAGCIHEFSARKTASFIVVNCTAIPDTLFEDELFGHEKGAFTGAINLRKGKFELANGGTLFLDEIGDIPLALQAKLLRVIEDSMIYRLGSDKPISIDVRIVSATNRNLEDMVSSGRFREDLFYRLNAFMLRIPPLRERKCDILPIAEHYLRIYARMYKKHVHGFTNGAKEGLLGHAWYGNVRELKHVIEKATIISVGSEITEKDVALRFHREGHKRLKATIEEAESREIDRAFRSFKGNVTRTADALGISRQTLRKKLHAYGIAH